MQTQRIIFIELLKGLVVKNTGSSFLVKTTEAGIVECVVKGNFRIKGLRSTNPVAIGDCVSVSCHQETYFITEIEERKNYIVRKPTNLSKQLHIIAANIDLALLVVTVKHPETNTTFIDRFLATAEAYRIPTYLLFNKIDLLDKDDLAYVDGLSMLYSYIGYPCFKLSAQKGEGIEDLSHRIQGKICLLSGNSGVGKSSLVNALCPELHVKVGDISECHDKGKHTTSFSEMFPIGNNTYIIDSPGIKGFNTVDMKPEEVGHFFPEIFKISQECKYNNCTHRNEPGCAVLEALQEQRISQSRYNSYLSIIDDFSQGKYRSAL